jgi:hypothetical protein
VQGPLARAPSVPLEPFSFTTHCRFTFRTERALVESLSGYAVGFPRLCLNGHSMCLEGKSAPIMCVSPTRADWRFKGLEKLR